MRAPALTGWLILYLRSCGGNGKVHAEAEERPSPGTIRIRRLEIGPHAAIPIDKAFGAVS